MKIESPQEIVNSIGLQCRCCDIRAVSVNGLPKREQDFFRTYMPSAKTAIVLGHHITKKEEWIWYAIDSDREYCIGDNHCLEVCTRIVTELKEIGLASKIIPYPEKSGLQFRFVAQAAGLGRIGVNAFLLHPDWGPWIHLRVIATDAIIDSENNEIDEICNHCGACISACPARAIEEKSFNGLQCRAFRKAKGEYVPIGEEHRLDYCEICADVCPIGDKPEKSITMP
jgi:epoxyqueuosine reductase